MIIHPMLEAIFRDVDQACLLVRVGVAPGPTFSATIWMCLR